MTYKERMLGGLRLTFVTSNPPAIMMEIMDPPAVPSIGDITETPDGKLWLIVQRAYLVPLGKSVISLRKGVEDCVELRCIIEEIDIHGKPIKTNSEDNTYAN